MVVCAAVTQAKSHQSKSEIRELLKELLNKNIETKLQHEKKYYSSYSSYDYSSSYGSYDYSYDYSSSYGSYDYSSSHGSYDYSSSYGSYDYSSSYGSYDYSSSYGCDYYSSYYPSYGGGPFRCSDTGREIPGNWVC